MSLAGRTFLVTRTREGNKLERAKLEKLGARVLEFPLIEIQPPSSLEKIDSAIDDLGKFDWIIFTSANGVSAFFSRLSEKGKDKNEIRAKFACIGPETKGALRREGFDPAFVPREFLTRKLGEDILKFHDLKGKNVLLARAEEGSKELGTILQNGGAGIVDAPVYKTVSKKIEGVSGEKILEQVTDITMTSPSTVRGLVLNFNPTNIRARKIRIHCIGPVTERSAREAGYLVDTVAKIHTIDGLIDALKSNL